MGFWLNRTEFELEMIENMIMTQNVDLTDEEMVNHFYIYIV